MVVFCCSVCGDSLKKNQVSKHYARCRMDMVSCLDCSKEYWGDDYQQHTKCISEEEKYSGKDYKPRPGQNKGDAKQDAWLQKVQNAIDKSNPSPKIRNILEQLKEFPNIPRKQAKFENFLKNSMKIRENFLVSQIWNILMSDSLPKIQALSIKEEMNTANKARDNQNGSEKKDCDNEGDINIANGENGNIINEERKISKRDKKEKRKEKQNRNEKKDRKINIDVDMNNDNGVNGTSTTVVESNNNKKKKSKKRKYEELDIEENNEKVEKTYKIKSRKEPKEPNEQPEENAEDEEEEEEEEEEETTVKQRKKICFDWEKIIMSLLKKEDDHRMSVKKVRKKVIAEYLFQGGYVESENKLKATFAKKIKNSPRLVCLKDEVRLLPKK